MAVAYWGQCQQMFYLVEMSLTSAKRFSGDQSDFRS